jgi:chromosomal replication initiation ATPase DnaA
LIQAIRWQKKFCQQVSDLSDPWKLPISKNSCILTGIIGKEDFIEEIKQWFGKDKQTKKSTREQPALRELDKSVPPDQLIDQYAQLVKLNREALTTKGKQSTERAMLMELLHRFCKITQPEIGRLSGGIDYSAVSQARKQLHMKIRNEPEWEKKFNQMQGRLSQMSRTKI